jgi:hypothetical protein
MMATTHALAGLLLGALSLFVAPEFAPAAMLAGFAGGVFPDLDLPGKHRKTLHFPVYYSVAAVPVLVLVIFVPTATSVALAIFLLAAALHSLTDMLGGGLELRPWEGTSERAVYSHYHGRWLRPRRWVGYDGSPADLALASVLAIPLFLFVEWSVIGPLVAGTLGISAVYTLVRKRLADIDENPAAFVPDSALPYVPERYL